MSEEQFNVKVVDLFAGCGALALGFQNAGFQVLAAFDNWKEALQCYRDNFPDHSVVDCDLGDVDKSIELVRKYKPDMIIGGPPCQDFSHARLRSTRGAGAGFVTAASSECLRTIGRVCSIQVARFIVRNQDIDARTCDLGLDRSQVDSDG